MRIDFLKESYNFNQISFWSRMQCRGINLARTKLIFLEIGTFARRFDRLKLKQIF